MKKHDTYHTGSKVIQINNPRLPDLVQLTIIDGDGELIIQGRIIYKNNDHLFLADGRKIMLNDIRRIITIEFGKAA